MEQRNATAGCSRHLRGGVRKVGCVNGARFLAWWSPAHGALMVNGDRCRGGWSWWLKLGLGFHV